MILLFTFTLVILVWAQCPNNSNRPSASQIPLTLYSFGTPATTSYAHILSSDPSVNASTVALGISLRTEYNLAATTVANYTADCPSSCFYSLTTKYFYNSTVATASMARSGDSYPGLNDATLKTVMCANAQGACGADVPIYVYYSGQYLDYYVSTDGGGPNSTASAYPAATVPPNIIPGTVLCWVWSIVTTTTQSSTTTTAFTTTNTASTTTNTGSTTTNTVSTTNTGTTTAFTGSTTPFTGSTTPPVTGTTTLITGTTTNLTGSTTKPPGTTLGGGTTQSGGGGTTANGGGGATVSGGGSSSDSSSSSGSSSSWWKIPVIAVGVLLLLGVVIGLLGLVTVHFINPAPPKKSVSPYSPSSNMQLPPQPVNALPAHQPLTVGPSMGYTPVY